MSAREQVIKVISPKIGRVVNSAVPRNYQFAPKHAKDHVDGWSANIIAALNAAGLIVVPAVDVSVATMFVAEGDTDSAEVREAGMQSLRAALADQSGGTDHE